MNSSLLALCLVCVAQADLPAEANAPDRDLAAEVQRLVRQLDDGQRAQRDAAEQALLALGFEALGLLPRVTSRTPAEVKERLGRVRKALELASAESISKPTVVTLEGDLSLAEALQALEQQTGNRVTGYERREGRVQVAFQNTPYWQALDDILDQAALKIQEFGGKTNALVVSARPPNERPRSGHAIATGVFRIEPVRLEARRDLRNPAVDGLRLTLNIAWEPRVSPITLRQPLSEIQATDERDQPLAVSGTQGALNASVELGMSTVDLVIPLQLPSRDVRQIRTLRGRLTALVPGPIEAFEFTDLEQARDVEQERAGAVVTFERLRKNVDLYEARMALRFDDAANALESHRGWVYRNEAYLVDAQGQKLESVGMQATRQGVNEVGVAYLFDLPQGPEGYRFVYKTPAVLLQLGMTYELSNIDLP